MQFTIDIREWCLWDEILNLKYVHEQLEGSDIDDIEEIMGVIGDAEVAANAILEWVANSRALFSGLPVS